jgi:hypothetical protein
MLDNVHPGEVLLGEFLKLFSPIVEANDRLIRFSALGVSLEESF